MAHPEKPESSVMALTWWK